MNFTRIGEFTWRVSDCEELVVVIHKRCGGRLWKGVRRNNRSGNLTEETGSIVADRIYGNQ